MDHNYSSDLKTFRCSKCNLIYEYKYSLTRHMRRDHNQQQTHFRKRASRFKCPDTACALTFDFRYKLREHIENDHGVSLEFLVRIFPTYQDFQMWKEAIEKETKSSYCKAQTEKLTAERNTLIYFICNKSGFPTGKPPRKKKRNIPSKKMNGWCPSSMDVIVSLERVEVRFWKTHFGHSCEIDCMRLSHQEKLEIANKLKEGVSFEKILDDVRDSILENDIQRIHLLKRSDLQNICKYFKIDRESVLQDGAENVTTWVDSLETLEDNPVVFYKEKGTEDWRLRNSDFLLVLMTKMQQNMLEKHTSGILCIDCIQSVNLYSFNLITLLTIDDYEIGCPLAFCISNRIDESIVSLFFNLIKGKVGIIFAKIFMAADMPLFYSSWQSVMGTVDRQFLCSWDVDKIWRKKLGKISCSATKKIHVYKTMRLLMSEQQCDKFQSQLNDTLKQLDNDDDLKKFSEYFRGTYLERSHLWAFCHRSQFVLQHSMLLEQVHRILNECHAEGRSVNSFVRCLNLIMGFSKDKILEKLQRESHIVKIGSDHQIHTKVRNIEVIKTKVPEKHLSVPRAEENCCFVEHNLGKICPPDCKPLCAACNICFHRFTCTCIDNSVNSNICRHIHASVDMLKSQCSHTEKQIEKAKNGKTDTSRDVETGTFTAIDFDVSKTKLISETKNKQIQIRDEESETDEMLVDEIVQDIGSDMSSVDENCNEENSQSLLLKKLEYVHYVAKNRTVKPEEYGIINKYLDNILSVLKDDH